jgi:YD repeat-containing protein
MSRICLALVVLLAALPAGAATTMGSAAGSFSVDQGSASYSVQLTVPPGTNGMAPSLSVVYSSGGRNGILGVGFNLQGVSAITRCGAQIVSDGFKGGVNYDANDRFCMNGQRLVQVGTLNGSPQYRTQKESWKRIVANGTCGSGPCSFTVQEKDGTVSTFGANGGSAVLAQGSRFTGSLAGSIRAWLMDTQTDLNGNSMSLAYTQTPSQVGGGTLSQTGTGQVYLDSITYTFSGGPAASRAVRFYYQQRPDPIVQFLGGGLIRTNLLLAQIATSITPAQCGGTSSCPVQNVMTYGFAYASPSPTTGRSRLSSLTQCSAAGNCFPPTNFTWSSGANGLKPATVSSPITGNDGWVGDFNGDGLTDFLQGPDDAQLYLATGSGFSAGQSPGVELDAYSNQVFGDFNGDGRTDIYLANSSQGYIYLGGGNPFTCANNCTAINIQQQDYLLPGDFNGDGMTDVLVASSTSGYIYLSNGSTLVQAGSFNNVGLGQGTNFVGDFNGDGRADVLSLGTSSGTLYFSSETSNTNTTLAAGVPLDSSSVVISGDQQWVGDFNGDGIDDLLVGSANTGTINYGTGTGLQKGNPITGLDVSDGSTWVGDFNGDGLADLYSASNTSGNLYLGNGATFTCVANPSNSSQCASISQNLSVDSSLAGDFNGDGMTDVFYGNNVSSAFNWAAANGTVATSNGAADMMVSVTDGYGGRTSITYKPLTDSSVYGESASLGNGVTGTRGLSNLYNPVPLFPSLVQTYPVEQVRGGQYVVASYTQSNDPAVNAAQPYSYTYGYYYQNALLNLVGRGFMGYGAITQTDPQLKAQTTTTYNQQFPFNGKPSGKSVCNQQSSSTCAAGAAQVEAVTLAWNCLDSQSQAACNVDNTAYQSNATQVFFVSPQSTIREDLLLGSRVTETFAFDDWGNPTLISAPGDANSPSMPLYTCKSYFPANESAWLFGFVQYDKKTANSGCLTNIATWQTNDLSLQQYAYDSRWNQTTTLGWDNKNSIWFGDYQTFNAQGLPITTADMSGSPAAAVSATTATTTYETGFQTFPASYTTAAPATSGDTQPLTIRYAYDARFGVAVAQQDPNGNIINTCVDDLGRTALTQGPIQGGASASANCLTAATYPYAASVFTGNANLVTTATTQYSIDSSSATMGTVSQTLNAWTGNAWTVLRSQMDGMGRTVAASGINDQNQTVVTRTQYLDAKHVLQGSLPTLSTATPLWKVFGYDALGRRTSLTSPYTDINGNSSTVLTTWTYQPTNVITLVEAAGTSLAQTVTSTLRYSGSKARVYTIARNGGTTTFSYDGLGRPTSTVTPTPAGWQAVVEGLAYDGLGRVVQRSDSNSGTRNYTYNSQGNLWKETDAKNQTMTYAWDNLHRAISQTQTTSAGQVQSVIQITYDVPVSGGTNVAGQRSTAGVYDASQKLIAGYQYGYDAYGRSTRQDITLNGTTYEVGTSYDPQGRTLTRTFPSISGARPVMQASYFAANGELASIQYAANGSSFATWATYSGYDAFGRPSGVAFGNNARETWSYNPEGRVSSQVVTDASGDALINAVVGWNQLSTIETILDCNYTGNAGNGSCAGRGGSSSNNEGSTYSYAGRRLTTADGPSGNLTYCYDPSGNVTLKEGVAFTAGPHRHEPQQLLHGGGRAGLRRDLRRQRQPGNAEHHLRRRRHLDRLHLERAGSPAATPGRRRDHRAERL